jgi:hypothetical protein
MTKWKCNQCGKECDAGGAVGYDAFRCVPCLLNEITHLRQALNQDYLRTAIRDAMKDAQTATVKISIDGKDVAGING